MRKIFGGLLLGVAVTALVAFKVATYEAKTSTAEVEQYQGVLYLQTVNLFCLMTTWGL
jgi:hypothetical protein